MPIACAVVSSETTQARGYLPSIKQQIADMAVNGSGIRDTARVLKISPTTVIEELKKSPSI
jgi:transposase-like protein